MLVAPLYARHKGSSRTAEDDQWSIPWILRFCYLIRALKYIFPLCLAAIGVIDFLVTWKYCGILPLFWSQVFGTDMKACLIVFLMYFVLYLIVLALDIAPAFISSEDPKIKCLLYLMVSSVLFCVSPFLLYAIFGIIFSFQTWTIESAEYRYVKWIHLNIIQYLQNDINTISKKYFRIARDRPLRIYIIMFKAIIMWLNIQLFQFLITDYTRYCGEWQSVLEQMEIEEKRRLQIREQQRSESNSCCCDGNNLNTECEEKYDEEHVHDDDDDETDSNIETYYHYHHLNTMSQSSISNTNISSNISSSNGCCDFNFNKNGIEYQSTRLDRYNEWCNERYFMSLRSPLAIMHEIVRSYPQTQIDYVNVYNLAQRHLYRYSNDIFDAAISKKHPVYAYAAISLYLWSTAHTILFFLCYHFGFKQDSNPVLGYIYLVEYIALFTIYTAVIFNVLHCDRLLSIIQNTSWFDKRLSMVIHDSFVGVSHDIEEDNGDLILKKLSLFYVHHKRVVQITIQHYMMLHILNLVLQNRLLSELIIEYLYGFHAFCEGDDNLMKLISNIIHGANRNEWGSALMNSSYDVDEWSLSKSQSELRNNEKNRNLDIGNLDDLPIPTDSNLIGISNRIINRPDIDSENYVVNDTGDLLNTFMEYRNIDGTRDEQPLCVCHEDDQGFIRMWDELNLDAVRLQYDAFKKANKSREAYLKEVEHQHLKTTKSLEFYFDFIRSLHYSVDDDIPVQ